MSRNAHHGAAGDDHDSGRGWAAIDLARALQRHLRHLPVVMLHDRRTPFAGPVLEHIAVGPGGVTVIAGRGHAAGVRQHLAALRHVVAPAVPMVGALCVDERDPQPLRPWLDNGVVIASLRDVAALASREGPLTEVELSTVVERIELLCPPAL